MATISFRAKPVTVYTPEGEFAYTYVQVPILKRAHCDMSAFRNHPRFRSYANSDLFPNMLAKLRRDRLGEIIRLDRIPDGVTVNTDKFLAVVSVDV